MGRDPPVEKHWYREAFLNHRDLETFWPGLEIFFKLQNFTKSIFTTIKFIDISQ